MTENQPLSILLVDDDAMVLQTLKRILEKKGYRVTVFSDPREALQAYAFSGQPFDLVVTDVLMPNLNGRQLAEQIWSYQPDQKVLFMSGETKGVITQKDLEEKGWRLFVKPSSTAEFLAAVQSMTQA